MEKIGILIDIQNEEIKKTNYGVITLAMERHTNYMHWC